ncbi:MAG: hypothetical protein C0508_00770 [Cyanobacteria bacterium PR.023]|nr:hypothetical protein [Cyanobacteria bacterium PR.023]
MLAAVASDVNLIERIERQERQGLTLKISDLLPNKQIMAAWRDAPGRHHIWCFNISDLRTYQIDRERKMSEELIR